MSPTKSQVVTLAAAALATPSISHAATTLDLGDDGIKGDSTIEEHVDWIELESFSAGDARVITFDDQGTPSATLPSFTEIEFTKGPDRASTVLLERAAGSTAMTGAEFHWIQQGGAGKVQVYLDLDLEEVQITSVSYDSTGDIPTETYTLHFARACVRYDKFDGDTVTPGETKCWDVPNSTEWNP